MSDGEPIRPSGTLAANAWGWGRFVVVHPAGHTEAADACERYRSLFVDPFTFCCVTLEELLDGGALPATTTAALRERHLPGPISAPAAVVR
jgi:hypothetical protein